MRFKYRVYYHVENTWDDGFKFINAKNDVEAMRKFKQKYPHLRPMFAI